MKIGKLAPILDSVAANKRYFVAILVISSVLFILLTTVLYQQYKTSQGYNAWVTQSYETLRKSRLLMVYILDIETGQRGYMLTGSKDFLTPYNASVEKLDATAEYLLTASRNNPEQYERALVLQNRIKEYKKILAGQMLRYGALGSRGVKLDDLKQSKQKMDDLRAVHQAFSMAEFDLLKQRLEFAKKQQKRYLLVLWTGSIISLGGIVIGNIYIFFLMMRNRQTVKELQESEERFGLVMHGVNDGIFDYNVAEDQVYFSPSYKALLGYTDQELTNNIETFNKLVHPEDLEQVWEVYRQYMRKKIPVYSQMFRMRHKNGSWRWVYARGVGIWNKRGKLTRLIGTHTNITEQKEREQELKQLNSDLESFTYLASHDLRAPLVNLKGFAGEIEYAFHQLKPILERTNPSFEPKEQEIVKQAFDHDIPEALVFVRSAVEKMDKLTAAILDISRLGGRVYRTEHVNANELVQRCLNAFAYDIASRKIEVTCAPLPDVVTDPLSLEQIFSNIIDNAIKYLDPSRTGKISISANSEGPEIVFCVSDNGRGIAEDDVRKVFDIFRRAGNVTGVRGIGMGMPYVQAILRKIGGTIWFESKLGAGTSFYFSIPKKE